MSKLAAGTDQTGPLRGHQALVTGAGDGIGAALARGLARAGAHVTAADLSFADPLPVPGVTHVALDVRDAAALRDLVASLPPIDLLISNAGVGYYATIEEADPAAVERLFAVNVLGAVHAAQAVLPGMRQRRRGTLVFLSSIAGRLTRPEGGFYAASKFALEALAETLHWEVAPFGLRVLVIEPGSIATRFVERARNGRAGRDGSPYAAVLAAVDPALPRLFARGQSPALVVDAVLAALGRDTAFERVPVGADASREIAAMDSMPRAAYLDRLRRLFGFGGEPGA